MRNKITVFMAGLALTAAFAGADATAQIEAQSFQSAGRSGGRSAAGSNARETEIYNDGTQSMNESNWEKAIEKFDEASRLHGRRVEGALYWKAFSQQKAGRTSDALSTCAELRRNYSHSRWLKECSALEIELRGAEDQPRAETQDDDLKLLALNRLMDHDEERAIPLVANFLNGAHSARLKERALFVLSQSDSPQAQALMGDIARGKTHPELQEKAVRALGVQGGRGLDTLAQIYSGANSQVKRRILQAYGVGGDRGHLLAAARSETQPELMKAAVQGLGIAGARQELRQLYQETASHELKSNILDAMIIDADAEYFAQVAKTEQDAKLRMKAIRGIGISGGHDSAAALVDVFHRNQDEETRNAALDGLFISNNAMALIDLARQEQNPNTKRRIVEKLSVMDSKDASDYMMEILQH